MLSKIVRSPELDDALQSIIHVPGVCEGVTAAGKDDPIVVSEVVLVGLLMDALYEGTTWTGWDKTALDESRTTVLQTAVSLLKTIFSEVVQLVKGNE